MEGVRPVFVDEVVGAVITLWLLGDWWKSKLDLSESQNGGYFRVCTLC